MPFTVVGGTAVVGSAGGVVINVDAVLLECVIEGGLLDSRDSA